jgi:hypothetical protein
MKSEQTEIRIRGKTIQTVSAEVEGRTVIVKGRWLKLAVIKDDELVQGEPVRDPKAFVEGVRIGALRADILSFAQKVPDTTPKHNLYFEWDNAAVVSTADYTDWWEKKLPQESRKNARRAAKRGVVVETAPFDGALVAGIKAIYDETPVRQGRKFWHYGKDLETVRMENATYLDRSEFIGAFLEGKLIGFIKLIYVDKVAEIVQILAMNEHQDKRPMNALLAKAVEVCSQKGITHLVYGKYSYGSNPNTPLAEFKRRNGFEQMNFPRYFVPLTLKGRLALRLKLHRSLTQLLPPGLAAYLIKVRAKLTSAAAQKSSEQPPVAASINKEAETNSA